MKAKVPLNVVKQEVIKPFNSINQEIFGIGVTSQKLELHGDKIIIQAVFKRIHILKILDEAGQREATVPVERALNQICKKALKSKIEDITGVPIKTILRDFDPSTEFSISVIYFESVLEE